MCQATVGELEAVTVKQELVYKGLGRVIDSVPHRSRGRTNLTT